MAQAEAEGRELEVLWDWTPGGSSSGQMPLGLSEIWQAPFRILQAAPPDEPCLETCHLEPFREFIQDGQFVRHFLRLTLRPKLAERIAAASALLSSPIMGVHIRTSEKHRDMVGLTWFRHRLEQLRLSDPQCTFYLSADDPVTSMMIHDIFGPAVIEQSKTYRYDRDGALAHAADLYVLIRYCKRVIGTNCSASSQVVALARGAKYNGPSHRPGGVSGGGYEDAWNPPAEGGRG
jgi:hypothetical protein